MHQTLACGAQNDLCLENGVAKFFCLEQVQHCHMILCAHVGHCSPFLLLWHQRHQEHLCQPSQRHQEHPCQASQRNWVHPEHSTRTSAPGLWPKGLACGLLPASGYSTVPCMKKTNLSPRLHLNGRVCIVGGTSMFWPNLYTCMPSDMRTVALQQELYSFRLPFVFWLKKDHVTHFWICGQARTAVDHVCSVPELFSPTPKDMLQKLLCVLHFHST